MSEHFRIGIQMTGEVARGALPSEFLVEGRDDLLDRHPRVGLQNCRYQLRPPDLAAAVSLAQFIELRAGGLLRPRPNWRGGREERAKAVADLPGDQNSTLSQRCGAKLPGEIEREQQEKWGRRHSRRISKHRETPQGMTDSIHELYAYPDPGEERSG